MGELQGEAEGAKWTKALGQERPAKFGKAREDWWGQRMVSKGRRGANEVKGWAWATSFKSL